MYRMFLIGAGFSKYAGLPLGNELWSLVLAQLRGEGLYDRIENDVECYIDYKKRVYGQKVSVENLEIEDFISYLDIEHFLGLKGSDTLSSIGNRTQIILKNSIAKVIHNSQQSMTPDVQSFYDNFCSSLHETDILISFNYDTIIEDSLKRLNKPFRLFPQKMKSVYRHSGEVADIKEVVLLKMHGSINWFDQTHHYELYKVKKEAGSKAPSRTGTIFSNPDFFHTQSLLEGPYFDNSPLNNIHILSDLNKYFTNKDALFDTPLIVSPSYFKFAYLNPIKDFWKSFNHAGTESKSLNIIGFSFPPHDSYIMQALANMVINFQNYNLHEELGNSIEPLRVIDFQTNEQAKTEFQEKLRFIDWDRAIYFTNGFNESSLSAIFNSNEDSTNN